VFETQPAHFLQKTTKNEPSFKPCQVDLGEQHQLAMTYYSVRHDGSPDFPRSWVLQVSAPAPHPPQPVLPVPSRSSSCVARMRAELSVNTIPSYGPQGSVDLCSWADLKRHSNDTTLKLPGARQCARSLRRRVERSRGA
jgi:hypothetical protein